MFSSLANLALLSTIALPALARPDSWGPAVSLGPTKSTIVYAKTILIPGRAPDPQTGLLFIWPGTSNGTGDLVQTTLESHPDGNRWCGAEPGEWCIRSSVFGKTGQSDGTAGIVRPGEGVLIEYELLEDHDTWRQTAYSPNGELLSSIESHSGPFMRGWGTAIECNQDCTPSPDEHYYVDTFIKLDGPDPGFCNTTSPRDGASGECYRSGDDMSIVIPVMRIPPMHIP